MPIQFMSTANPQTLTTFVSELTTIFTSSIVTAITAVGTMIIDNPFLSFTVVMLFAGGIIGLFGRVLSRG